MIRYSAMLVGAAMTLVAVMPAAQAEPLFFDDFEDRVIDQAKVGNNWTWYDMTFEGDTCTGEPIAEFGPFSDDDPSDYEVDNRNYATASEEAAGQGDSYFRAGLEVPAWEGALSNMLRVYGNQFNDATSCERTHVFQEYTLEAAGTYSFAYDMAHDQNGAPANGEITKAFVKVLKQSDLSYEEILFETQLTIPPVATTPENVTTARQALEFTIPEEFVGELLQFGFFNDLAEDLGQSWGSSAVLYDNVTMGRLELGPAHSGSWWNEDQSGHGFSVEIGQLKNGTRLAVITWYTYDSEGNPIFLTGLGTPNGQELTIDFQSPVGMKYGDFDPDTVVREDGGTAVIVFSDRENATFSYMPSMFTESTWGHMEPIEDLPITKLFGIPADPYYSDAD